MPSRHPSSLRILDPEACLCEAIAFEVLRHATLQERLQIEAQFATLPVLTTPTQLWRDATRLGQICRDKGHTAGSLDLLIAALTIHHSAELVNPIFTIGHSTHSAEAFLALLRRHDISALADVRSSPFSRFNPQFNRRSLEQFLKEHSISYVFLGKELGARSDDPSCYQHGRVQYSRLATTSLFHAGLERVLRGSGLFRVALMCAEKEPLNCHRTLLVARALAERGQDILDAYKNIFPWTASSLVQKRIFHHDPAVVLTVVEIFSNKK